MRIEIEYCVPCKYLERAQAAQQEILETFGLSVSEVALVTGDKGVFKIRANGEEIYSKPAEFDIAAVIQEIKSRL